MTQKIRLMGLVCRKCLMSGCCDGTFGQIHLASHTGDNTLIWLWGGLWLWGTHRAKWPEESQPVAVPALHCSVLLKKRPGCPQELCEIAGHAGLPRYCSLLMPKVIESLKSRPPAPKASLCACNEPSKGSDF